MDPFVQKWSSGKHAVHPLTPLTYKDDILKDWGQKRLGQEIWEKGKNTSRIHRWQIQFLHKNMLLNIVFFFYYLDVFTFKCQIMNIYLYKPWLQIVIYNNIITAKQGNSQELLTEKFFRGDRQVKGYWNVKETTLTYINIWLQLLSWARGLCSGDQIVICY